MDVAPEEGKKTSLVTHLEGEEDYREMQMQ
jgi:hypothetical protein